MHPSAPIVPDGSLRLFLECAFSPSSRFSFLSFFVFFSLLFLQLLVYCVVGSMAGASLDSPYVPDGCRELGNDRIWPGRMARFTH